MPRRVEEYYRVSPHHISASPPLSPTALRSLRSQLAVLIQFLSLSACLLPVAHHRYSAVCASTTLS